MASLIVRASLLACLSSALLACSKDKTGPEPERVIVLQVDSGDAQTAQVATQLSIPIVIRATDENGRPVANVPIRWQETSNGTLQADTLTDAQGKARARWLLGTSAGEKTLTASTSIGRVGEVVIRATARRGPAVRLTILPQSFSLLTGDSMQLSVTASDLYGNPVDSIPSGSVTWSAEFAGNNVSVNQRGVVRAVAIRFNDILARFENATGRSTVYMFDRASLSVGPAIATGQNHACALTPDGRAFCWGSNDHGQLGNGSNEARSLSPVEVTGGHRFARIAAGAAHTCALTAVGLAFCWGENTYGQLGNGNTTDQRAPAPIAANIAFVSIDGGLSHTCGLTTPVGNAYLWCWGRNDVAQLARNPLPLGSSTNTGPFVSIGSQSSVPTRTATLVRGLNVGPLFSCLTSTSDALYCWGDNTGVQLQGGTTRVDVPTLQLSGTRIESFSAGGQQVCWITDQRAHCRGTSGTSANLVAGQTEMTLVTVGQNHACGLRPDRSALCWGRNDLGQLGDGNPTTMPGSTLVVPVVPALAALSAGWFFTCGVDQTGQAWCWGDGSSGKLGNGSEGMRASPTRVAGGITFAH
jgi:alpha-tubulin suppressor-like RCC1 family protein